MEEQDLGALRGQLENMKSGIREITHDMSSPLGVLRMATYYLQTAKPDEAKREHYYRLISDTLDKVEGGLKKLRNLSENPLMNAREDTARDTK